MKTFINSWKYLLVFVLTSLFFVSATDENIQALKDTADAARNEMIVFLLSDADRAILEKVAAKQINEVLSVTELVVAIDSENTQLRDQLSVTEAEVATLAVLNAALHDQSATLELQLAMITSDAKLATAERNALQAKLATAIVPEASIKEVYTTHVKPAAVSFWAGVKSAWVDVTSRSYGGN